MRHQWVSRCSPRSFILLIVLIFLNWNCAVMCTKMRAFEPLVKRELKTEGFTVKSTMKNSVVSTWVICYSSFKVFYFILFKLTLNIDRSLVIINADEFTTTAMLFKRFKRCKGFWFILSDSVHDKWILSFDKWITDFGTS